MNNSDKITMGRRIRELRLSRKLTQKKLSQNTGISYQSIMDYENGRREPNNKAMVALEQYFNVSGAYLRGESDEPETLYKWDDHEVMDAVTRGFPNQFQTLLDAILQQGNLEQKMVFDILVELRHVLLTKRMSDVQRQASLLLLQDVFVASTHFADICSSASSEEPADLSRMETAKGNAINQMETACGIAIDSMVRNTIIIHD